MNQLVLGASGLLGGFIYRTLVADARGEVLGTYHRVRQPDLIELAIEDRAAVDALVAAIKPAVIYLAAAQPNVDWCEREPQAAYDVNVRGTEHVARAAARAGAKLVFFSSDYVFRGDAPPYNEGDQCDPLNIYGTHKVMSEQVVLANCPSGLIIRSTGIYGTEVRRKNFVYRVIDTLTRGADLVVPNDQIGTPTYAGDIATVIRRLVDADACGIFHAVGPVAMPRHDFAHLIARIFGLPPDAIVAVDSARLGQVAPRPLAPVLDAGKVRAACDFAFQEPEPGLRAMAREMETLAGSPPL